MRSLLPPDAETETDGFRPAIKETRRVQCGDSLHLPMARAGGFAAIIE